MQIYGERIDHDDLNVQKSENLSVDGKKTDSQGSLNHRSQEDFFKWVGARVDSKTLAECQVGFYEFEEYAKRKKILSDSELNLDDSDIICRIRDSIKNDKQYIWLLFQKYRRISDIADRIAAYTGMVENEETDMSACAENSYDSEKDAKDDEIMVEKNEAGHVLNCEWDGISRFLNDNGVEFIDNRQKGGALWVVKDKNADKMIGVLKKCGITLKFGSMGGKGTRKRAGWWTYDEFGGRIIDIQDDASPGCLSENEKADKITQYAMEQNDDTSKYANDSGCKKYDTKPRRINADKRSGGTIIDDKANARLRNEMRDGFRQWMERRQYFESTINSYLRYIDIINAYIGDNRLGIRTLYETGEINDILRAMQVLKRDQGFHEIDDTENGALIRTLDRFLNYYKSVHGNKYISKRKGSKNSV